MEIGLVHGEALPSWLRVDGDRQRRAIRDRALALEPAAEPIEEHHEPVRELVAVEQQPAYVLELTGCGEHLGVTCLRLAAQLAVGAARGDQNLRVVADSPHLR